MRTTLDIDADILDAAKEMARAAHTTAGRVISDTMRRAIRHGLTQPQSEAPPPRTRRSASVYGGFVPFAAGRAVVTNDLVRRLRDESGD